MQPDDQMMAALKGALGPFLKARSLVFSSELLDRDLFGADGILDSVDFVSFLVDFEQAVRTYSKKMVLLSDDRAFSSEKSPFRNLKTLLDYTSSVLSEAE